MARMRLLVPVAGEEAWRINQVVEVDEETAAKWCDGERAVRVQEPSGEKATANPAGEQATATPEGEQATAVPGGETASREAPTRKPTGRRPA